MNRFERQLKKVLSSDETEELVDSLEDEENMEEMLPIVFEPIQSEMVVSEENKDLQSDYEFARSNYYGLIGRSNAALDLILKIAQMSEHPKAIEVAAGLIKTSSDVTRELLALQKTVSTAKAGGRQKGASETYVQNNTFVSYNKEKEENEIKDIDSQLDDLK